MAIIYIDTPGITRWSSITTGSGPGGQPSTNDYIYIGVSNETTYAGAAILLVDVENPQFMYLYVGRGSSGYNAAGILRFEAGRDYLLTGNSIYIYDHGYFEAEDPDQYEYAVNSSSDPTQFVSTGGGNESCYFSGYVGRYVEVGDDTNGYEVWVGARGYDLDTYWASNTQGIATYDPDVPFKKMQWPALPKGQWYDMGFFIPRMNGGDTSLSMEGLVYNSSAVATTTYTYLPNTLILDVYSAVHFNLYYQYSSTSIYFYTGYMTIKSDTSSTATTQFGLYTDIYNFTLASDITNTDTIITVNESLANLYNTGRTSGFITIDDEIIYYDSLDTINNRFLGCVRGEGGTTAAAHTTGTTVAEGGFIYYKVPENKRVIRQITADTDFYSPGRTFTFGSRDSDADYTTQQATEGAMTYWKRTAKIPAGKKVRKPRTTIRDDAGYIQIYIYNSFSSTPNLNSTNPQLKLDTVLVESISFRLDGFSSYYQSLTNRKIYLRNVWASHRYNYGNKLGFLEFNNVTTNSKDTYYDIYIYDNMYHDYYYGNIKVTDFSYNFPIWHITCKGQSNPKAKIVAFSKASEYYYYTYSLIPINFFGNADVNAEIEVIFSTGTRGGLIGYYSASGTYPEVSYYEDKYTEIANKKADPVNYNYTITDNVTVTTKIFSSIITSAGYNHTGIVQISKNVGEGLSIYTDYNFPTRNLTVDVYGNFVSSLVYVNGCYSSEAIKFNPTFNIYNAIYIGQLGYTSTQSYPYIINATVNFTTPFSYLLGTLYTNPATVYQTSSHYDTKPGINFTINGLIGSSIYYLTYTSTYCYNDVSFTFDSDPLLFVHESQHNDLVLSNNNTLNLCILRNYINNITFNATNIYLYLPYNVVTAYLFRNNSSSHTLEYNSNLFINKYRSIQQSKSQSIYKIHNDVGYIGAGLLINTNSLSYHNITVSSNTTLYDIYSSYYDGKFIRYPWLVKNSSTVSNIAFTSSDTSIYYSTSPSIKYTFATQNTGTPVVLFAFPLSAGTSISFDGWFRLSNLYTYATAAIIAIDTTNDTELAHLQINSSEVGTWKQFTLPNTLVIQDTYVIIIFVVSGDTIDSSIQLWLSDANVQINNEAYDFTRFKLASEQYHYIQAVGGGGSNGSGGGSLIMPRLLKQKGSLRALTERY